MTVLETRPLNARLFKREALEHYSEPFWCSARLFAEEKFESGIWDPCCGVGRIPDSAVRAGLYGIGTDIVDRGYRDFAGRLDFLKTESSRSPNIVCNPPFSIAPEFAAKALSFEGTQKVAMIFPVARLNAAHWLQGTPLARVGEEENRRTISVVLTDDEYERCTIAAQSARMPISTWMRDILLAEVDGARPEIARWGTTPDEAQERNDEIRAAREAGADLATLSKQYGLSMSRLSVIFNHETNPHPDQLARDVVRDMGRGG